MTHETLAKVMERFNEKDRSLHIISTTKLSDDIDYIKARNADASDSAYVDGFYIIKDILGDCVAIILDMGKGDLHLYTDEKHRCKGIMSSALNSTVSMHRKFLGYEYQQLHFESSEMERWAVNNIDSFYQPSNIMDLEKLDITDFTPGEEEVDMGELFRMFIEPVDSLMRYQSQVSDILSSSKVGDKKKKALREAIKNLDCAVYALED